MYRIHPIKWTNIIRSRFNLTYTQEVNLYNDLVSAFDNPKVRVNAKEMNLDNFTIKTTAMNSRFNRQTCELLYDLIRQ